MGQTELFSASESLKVEPGKKLVRHRKRAAVTFSGGQVEPAHRWFRLTPSFSPDLVRDVVSRYGDSNSVVLDPFSGRGTTPIECQRLGLKCYGVEINPALHFAGTTSLCWNVSPEELRSLYISVLSAAKNSYSNHIDKTPEEFSEIVGTGLPAIHNVYRWWHPAVLKGLVAIKAALAKVQDQTGRNLLNLALMSILLDSANITLGRLQLHFIERSAEEINPFALFESAVGVVCEDLASLSRVPNTHGAEIFLGDNRNSSSLLGDRKANLVITSPPYPNRYSYVWNTRPHLYFMEWLNDAPGAAKLDCNTIGGTWGAATTRHTKAPHGYPTEQVAEIVSPIVNEIRDKDPLMANYVAMYFNDLYSSICETRKSLTSGAVCAYVVGNSRAKGSLVKTEELLAHLFEAAGYSALGNEEVRKRNSGSQLTETIVFAQA